MIARAIEWPEPRGPGFGQKRAADVKEQAQTDAYARGDERDNDEEPFRRRVAPEFFFRRVGQVESRIAVGRSSSSLFSSAFTRRVSALLRSSGLARRRQGRSGLTMTAPFDR